MAPHKEPTTQRQNLRSIIRAHQQQLEKVGVFLTGRQIQQAYNSKRHSINLDSIHPAKSIQLVAKNLEPQNSRDG
jgi:hypothetical protein